MQKSGNRKTHCPLAGGSIYASSGLVLPTNVLTQKKDLSGSFFMFPSTETDYTTKYF